MKVKNFLIAGILMLVAVSAYSAQYELKIEKTRGKICPKCVEQIEGALKSKEGVNEVKANLKGEVYLDLDTQKVNSEDIIATIEGIDAGKFKVKEVTQTINIKGMTCAGCVMAVKKALNRLEGVKDTKVSFRTLSDPSEKENQATVTYDPEKVSTSQMVDAISRAGFKPTLPK